MIVVEHVVMVSRGRRVGKLSADVTRDGARWRNGEWMCSELLLSPVGLVITLVLEVRHGY
jgi:hypothetical protein